MKKRLFAIALSLCMTLSLLPTAAFAAENGESGTTVTQSGGVQSETIAAAIQAGDSYTLTGDMTESVTIPQGKTFTLNLGGYTLTNETNKHTITVEKGATLTIEGTGKVDNVSHGKGALVNLGTTTLNGGMFTRSKEAGKYSPYGNGGNSWYTIDNGGTLTINKGVSVDNNGGYSSMIRNGADSSRKGSTLIINGGTFDGGINTVKNDEYGVLTINGGEFTNTAQFVIMNWNEATIKGGNFQTKDTAQAVLFTAKYAEEGAVGKLTIHNGTFEKASDKQELICNHYDENGKVLYTGTAVITGGTFSTDPSAYITDATLGALKIGDSYKVLKKATATFQIEDGLNLSLKPDNKTWNVYVGATFADAGYTEFPTLVDPDYVYGGGAGNHWCYLVDGKRDPKDVSLNDEVKGNVTFVTAGDKMSYWFIDVDEETKAALKDPKTIQGMFAPHDKITFEVNPKDGYTAHAYYVEKETSKTTDIKLENNVGTFEMPTAMITLKIEYIENIKNDQVKEQPEFKAGDVATVAPDTNGKTDEVINAMKDANNTITSAKADEATLTTTAKQSVENGTVDLNKVTGTEANTQQIAGLLKDQPAGTKATIMVVPFLEIQVKDAQVENNVVKSVTINVTPKVAIKATTDASNMTGTNTVTLSTQNMTVTNAIEMTLPVPENWTAGKAFVLHKGYVYEGTLNNTNHTIEFKNPHGFSDFTVTNEDPTVAKNGETSYTDLAQAINEAKADATITLTAKANGANVTTNRDNKNVTIKNGSDASVTVKINGTEIKLDANAEQSITTPRASSGGGGSASTGYTVTAPSAKNGSVSVTPKNASKGDTVTVTVKADKGYELSKLTVTDKNGKTVKLTDKGNGKYTFTMPGSKVEVKAEFVETVTEPENPFRDVNKNAYYYKQVLWAVEKGITSGVSANEFAPEAACTRGQMVTFLWKAAGSPEVSGALAFDDVSSDAYYAKAVRWAAQQGITSGTSAGVFSPDAPCTRGQMAMFLYAYAKTPAVTGSVPFGDVASGDYFNTAVLWAVNNGITSGTSSTTYSPASVCTRGQMVVFLYQLLNK